MRREDAEPVGLDELLVGSRVIFVLAAMTSANGSMLGRRELELIPPGGVLLVLSGPGVVDFEALVMQLAIGRLPAVDVFPREPVAPDDLIRSLDGILLSPHRAGGMPEAYREIGRLVVADLELILSGLPPVACKRAERETVGLMRSRPVERS